MTTILARAPSLLRRTALSVALLSACKTSPAPANYAPARSQHGVAGTLTMQNGQTYSGELLTIDDSAYVLLTNGKVGVARFGDLRRADFQELGSSSGKRPSDERLARARLFARFPFGIPAAGMKALLAESAQDAPDDLARTGR